MKPLVLTEFGSRLSVRGFRLIVNGESYEARNLPFDSIYFTHFTGNISLEAVRFCAEERIPIHILNWRGELQSSILQAAPIKGDLRLAQYRAFFDSERRREISERIIEEKTGRMESLLARLDKPRHLIRAESGTSKAYWNALGEVFRSLGYEWNGRKNLGGKNWRATTIPNALLNYGYSVLQAIVRTEVNLFGLDDSLGFLHQTYRRQPLAQPLTFDLSEKFRPDVDLSVIRLLEEKPRITARDFCRLSDYSLHLWPDTGKRVVERVSSETDALEVRTYVRDFARNLIR